MRAYTTKLLGQKALVTESLDCQHIAIMTQFVEWGETAFEGCNSSFCSLLGGYSRGGRVKPSQRAHDITVEASGRQLSNQSNTFPYERICIDRGCRASAGTPSSLDFDKFSGVANLGKNRSALARS
jgi:hypothetical protein